MSIKDLNDPVGNRNRELPPCSTVSLPTEPHICEILSEEICIKVISNLELSDAHQLQQQYLAERTLPIRKTLPRLFRIHRTASKETPKVRVRLLLHPVDTFISMAVTSFYLGSSLETATLRCDGCVIYYNRLHWPREFGFGSPHSVPSNFLSATVAGGLAPTEITCLHLPIQCERTKESLFAPFQKKTHEKKTFTFCPLESSFFYLFLKDSALFI